MQGSPKDGRSDMEGPYSDLHVETRARLMPGDLANPLSSLMFDETTIKVVDDSSLELVAPAEKGRDIELIRFLVLRRVT